MATSLGSMLPGYKWSCLIYSSNWATLTCSNFAWSGFCSSQRHNTNQDDERGSASTNSAKRWDAKSLSITASTPDKLPICFFSQLGYRHHRHATTTWPSFNKVRMVLISLISTGFGEANNFTPATTSIFFESCSWFFQLLLLLLLLSRMDRLVCWGWESWVVLINNDLCHNKPSSFLSNSFFKKRHFEEALKPIANASLRS